MATPIGNYLGWALSNQLNQNPTLSYLEGMKAAGVPAEMQLRSAQAQQAMNELEKERRMQTAMQGIDISTPEGMQQAIGAAGKVDPMVAMKLNAVMQSMQVDARKAFSETLNNTSKFIKDTMPGVTSVQQYIPFYQAVSQMSPLIASSMIHPKELMNPDGSSNEARFQAVKKQTLYGAQTLSEAMKPPPMEKFHSGETEVTQRWNPEKGQFETIATAPRDAGGKWSFQTVTDNQGKTQIIPINPKTLEVGPPIATKNEPITPEATDFLARMMLADPKSLPAMGFGPQMRQPVFNRAAQIALQEGINPQDTAIKSAVMGTIKQGLGQLEGQTQRIEGFVKTFDKNLLALRQQSAKVGRTGVPLANEYILWTQNKIAGNPEISAFNVLLKSVANEAARITSSATGGGVTAESEMAKWEGMIRASQTPAQLNAALDAMNLESQNRLSSNREQINLGQRRLKEMAVAPTVGEGGTQPPSGGAPQQYPDTISAGGKTGRKTGKVDGNGIPIYRLDDGTEMVPSRK